MKMEPNVLYKTAIWFVLMGITLSGAQAEPQSKDYLPPKAGGAGGRRPGQDDGPSEPANYNYSYEVQNSDNSVDFGHSEKRMNDLATGSYHVLLPDGRTQIVEYEAGPDGYRPQVRYEGEAIIQGDGKGGDAGYNYNAASNHEPVRQAAPISISSSATKSTQTQLLHQ